MSAVEDCGGVAAPVVAWEDGATRRAFLGDGASASLHHPFGGRERIFVPPWRIEGAFPGFTRRAPLMGEHTDAVLAALHSCPTPKMRSSDPGPVTCDWPRDLLHELRTHMSELTFRAFQATEPKKPAELVHLSAEDLPAGDLLVKVTHSSLNYKDGLAILGRPGVVRTFPLICGIDLAGEVVDDAHGFAAGDNVILTGSGLSETRPGGYSQYQRIMADHVVATPSKLGPWGAMAIGTAGLTAMLCILRLEAAGLTPDRGPVLVTGATGGVGTFAVSTLARLGYEVHASTGKEDEHAYLASLGATTIVPREKLTGEPRALDRQQWAACVDCVGGVVLANVLARMDYSGVVAACGLAGGTTLPATVLPFILRNVSLLGVDSVNAPLELRRQAWDRLDDLYSLTTLKQVAVDATLEDLPRLSEQILRGQIRGRVVVTMSNP